MKIRKKNGSSLILIGLGILLFVLIYFLVTYTNRALKPYSVFNARENGISLFYEALKEMDYDVSYKSRPLNRVDKKHLQILIVKDHFEEILDTKIIPWAAEGGNVVVLYEGSYNIVKENYGKGSVITADSHLIINDFLWMSRHRAYQLLEEMNDLQYDKIFFNDYYYEYTGEKNLWKDMPLVYKLIIIQLLGLLIVLIYYYGKRFGKPVPLTEEVERSENEFLYAVSALYQRGNHWEVIFEHYYLDFIRKLSKVFPIQEEDFKWIDLWEKKKLPKLNLAKELIQFMNKKEKGFSNRKQKAKYYKAHIIIIEKLNKVISERSKEQWNL